MSRHVWCRWRGEVSRALRVFGCASVHPLYTLQCVSYSQPIACIGPAPSCPCRSSVDTRPLGDTALLRHINSPRRDRAVLSIAVAAPCGTCRPYPAHEFYTSVGGVVGSTMRVHRRTTHHATHGPVLQHSHGPHTTPPPHATRFPNCHVDRATSKRARRQRRARWSFTERWCLETPLGCACSASPAAGREST